MIIYYITIIIIVIIVIIIIIIIIINLKELCNSYFHVTSKNHVFHTYVHYFSSNNSKRTN